jgi:hypothetical protein
MNGIVYKPQTTIKAHALSDSWLSGQRSKHLSRKESWNIGLSTSMGPYNFRVQEPEF